MIAGETREKPPAIDRRPHFNQRSNDYIQQAGREGFDIASEKSPVISPILIDDSFTDVSGYQHVRTLCADDNSQSQGNHSHTLHDQILAIPGPASGKTGSQLPDRCSLLYLHGYSP